MRSTFERRKNKRYPIQLNLSVNRMFRQDNIFIENLNAEIEVFDISKTGIGFTSEAKLPEDYYFDAAIALGENNFFYTVVHILRATKKEGIYIYGADFIGLAPFLANKIEQFERERMRDNQIIGKG